jgi:hypothetical protein
LSCALFLNFAETEKKAFGVKFHQGHVGSRRLAYSGWFLTSLMALQQQVTRLQRMKKALRHHSSSGWLDNQA